MKRICIAALLSLALTAPAQAARPSYSYFDAAYLAAEVDDSSTDSDGLRFALSTSLNRWFYFTGGHDRLERDNSDSTRTQTSLGLGLHTLKNTFQFFAAGSYERLDRYGGDLVRVDTTDEGYGVLLGARLPLNRFELQADYKYVNFGDFQNGSRNDEDRYRFSALAHLGKRFALTASYEIFEQAEELEQWSAGLRYYFKNRNDLPRKKRAVSAETPSAAPASADTETETQ